jgi:hypothetical protein
MSEVDLNTLPPLLPADVQRSFESGLPTEAQMDWEQYQQNWFKTQVVSLDTKLTEVSGEVDDQTGKITELTAVVQNEDGTLTAGKLVQVSTDTAANTATISDLTTSVAGIAVRKTVTATFNNGTGFYELAGVQNGDGSGPVFTMAFQANNFLLTDPSYLGGAPQNVFSYSGTLGAFFFNVPVVFNGGLIIPASVTQNQLAVGAVTQFNSNVLTGDQLIGAGSGNTNRVVAGFSNNYTADGNPSLLDFSITLDMNVVGASGFPVTVVVYLAIDGAVVKTLQRYDGIIFNSRTVAYVTVKIPLIGPNAFAAAAGVHTIDILTTFVPSAPGSQATIKGTTTDYAWVLFKR